MTPILMVLETVAGMVFSYFAVVTYQADPAKFENKALGGIYFLIGLVFILLAKTNMLDWRITQATEPEEESK